MSTFPPGLTGDFLARILLDILQRKSEDCKTEDARLVFRRAHHLLQCEGCYDTLCTGSSGSSHSKHHNSSQLNNNAGVERINSPNVANGETSQESQKSDKKSPQEKSASLKAWLKLSKSRSLTRNLGPKTSNSESLTRNLSPETSNSESLTRNLGPETSKSERLIRNLSPETSNSESFAKNANPETSNFQSLTKRPSPRPETFNSESEIDGDETGRVMKPTFDTNNNSEISRKKIKMEHASDNLRHEKDHSEPVQIKWYAPLKIDLPSSFPPPSIISVGQGTRKVPVRLEFHGREVCKDDPPLHIPLESSSSSPCQDPRLEKAIATTSTKMKASTSALTNKTTTSVAT